MSEPGIISSRPAAERYWKVPAVTMATVKLACRSSYGRSPGPEVKTTSPTLQPSPPTSQRVVVQPALPSRARRSRALSRSSAIFAKTRTSPVVYNAFSIPDTKGGDTMYDHVSLKVKDGTRSRRFFQRALAPLGYKVIDESEGGPDSRPTTRRCSG